MHKLRLLAFASILLSSSALCQDARVSGTTTGVDGKEVVDTITVFDPVTRMEIQVKAIYVKPPCQVNGQRVYGVSEVSKPPKLDKPTKGQSPEKYIMSALTGTFSAFPNGRYRIYANYAIIDKAGKCVQCRVASVKRLGRLYCLLRSWKENYRLMQKERTQAFMAFTIWAATPRGYSLTKSARYLVNRIPLFQGGVVIKKWLQLITSILSGLM